MGVTKYEYSLKRDRKDERTHLSCLCFRDTNIRNTNMRIREFYEYTNFTNPRILRMHEILRMVWIFEWVWEESAKIMNTPNYIKSRRIGVNR